MNRTPLIAVAMVAVASVVAIASFWHDAPIVDEIPHIGAGYGYIFEQSYQFNPEHPPLAKDLAGIGLKLAGITNETAVHQAFLEHSAITNDQWNFGRQLLYGLNENAIRLVHAAKLSVLLLFIFSALIIFIWTRKLYGRTAALVATFLFSFSPTVIAHARLVTTDMVALFGVLLATYFFVAYLQHQSRKNFWLAVVGLGIALLCKFSTFLLVPFFILLAISWAFAHRQKFFPILGRTILVIILAFIVIVGPYYQFHLTNYPTVQQRTDTANQLASFGNKTLSSIVIYGTDKPIFRPFAEYGLGLLMVTQRIEGGNRIYFLSKVVNQGGPWYFPIVYALKEPIPFLILLLMAIITGLAVFLRGRLGSFRHAIATNFPQSAMLLWLLIYWIFSINSTVNIGIRHLIPIYGFTIILVAGQLTHARLWHKKYLKILISILLAWYLAEFASVYPYYLTYFNEIAGGPAGGYRYVTDSNLDWGQDLYRLGQWAKQNNIKKINLDYFGWADQRYYLGDTFSWIVGGQYTNREAFLRDNPQGGYIAVSATYYQQSLHSNSDYAWLEKIKPLTVIGHSIFVWEITR